MNKKSSRRPKQEEIVIQGNFQKDYPSHISGHQLVGSKTLTPSQNAIFKLEWKLRHDGTQPDGSFYYFKDLKEVCPSLLMTYLEKYVKLT